MDSEYKKLLQQPEWREKRLEILQRDNFTCQFCGSKDNLQVHHMKYIDGHKPWEYPLELLITLCGDCHYSIHEKKIIEKKIKAKKKELKKNKSKPKVKRKKPKALMSEKELIADYFRKEKLKRKKLYEKQHHIYH